MSHKDNPAGGAALDLDHFICFAVYSAGHAFNQIYRPLLDAVGLTYPQYLVMVTLWQKPDQTVKEIGKRLYLESSTLTPLLKRLEALGHITRSRDLQDERQVRVGLTAQGVALRQKAEAIPACISAATGRPTADLLRLGQEIGALRDAMLRQDQD